MTSAHVQTDIVTPIPAHSGKSTVGRYHSSTITIALGGFYNAGKTSLINRLTGMELPTSRIPETAVPTYLRAEDSADSITKLCDVNPPNGTNVEKPFQVASLYDYDGQRILSLADRFDLVVPAGNLPADLVLVDTPGCNDEPDVTKRAKIALSQADHIVWVTSSKAPLTLDEQGILRELSLKRGGWEGFTILVNVFLETTSVAQWHEFAERDLLVIEWRIKRCLHTLGTNAEQIPIHVLCADAPPALADALGIGAFRSWLFDRDKQVAIARSSRSAQLDLRRRRLEQAFKRQLDRAHARLARANDERKAHAEQAKQIAALSKAVREAVDLGFQAFEQRSTSILEEIAASVSCPPLRNSAYQDAASAAFQRASNCLDILIAIDRTRGWNGLPPLDHASQRRLSARFPRFEETIVVADTPLRKDIVATGGFGILAGPIGLAAALALSTRIAFSRKNTADQRATQEAIAEIAAAMATQIRGDRLSFRELAAELAVPPPPKNPQPIQPFARRVEVLEARQLAVQAMLDGLSASEPVSTQ